MALKTQNNAVKTTLWQVTGKERPLPIYWPSTPPPQVITKFDKRQITFKSRKIVIYAYFSITFTSQAVPSGYPNPTRYPVFLSIPDPTQFSFRNHRVAGNPKHRVLPDISGKPEVSGTTRYSGYHP